MYEVPSSGTDFEVRAVEELLTESSRIKIRQRAESSIANRRVEHINQRLETRRCSETLMKYGSCLVTRRFLA